MSTHTPGPWHWGAHPREDIAQVYHGEDADDPIADVYEVANARLIAAAPLLYDACRQLVASAGEGDWKELANAVRSAREAIAQAEGA